MADQEVERPTLSTPTRPLGPYSYIRVNDLGSDKAKVMDMVRTEFWDFHKFLQDTIPAGRYQSLALTALEQASLWAQRALALEYTDDGG